MALIYSVIYLLEQLISTYFDQREMQTQLNGLSILVTLPILKVNNTHSWPEYTDSQVDDCDEQCEAWSMLQTAENNPDIEACLVRCLIPQQCIEVPDMDVG